MKSFEQGNGGIGGVQEAQDAWAELTRLNMKPVVVENDTETAQNVAEKHSATAEVSAEAAGDADVAGREELHEWLEAMQKPLDEYWQGLIDEQWVNAGVPLEYFVAPKTDWLVDGAKKMLHEKMPELGEAGIERRAEMATKVALQDLVQQEADAVVQAKVNFRGERKLKKGWDEKLLHQAYYAMRDNVAQIYGEVEAAGDELSEQEQVAWWAQGEPENAVAKQELARVRQTAVPETPSEAANEPPVQKLAESDVEVLPPAVPENGEPVVDSQTDEIGEAGVPSIVALNEQQEDEPAQPGLETVIDLTQRAAEILEQKNAVLEDYNPGKAELAQMLDELSVQLVNIKAKYAALAEDIAEGERQKELGLITDRVPVGDSEIYRRGELALEELYAQGTLEREQPEEVQLEFLQSFRERAESGIAVEAKRTEGTQRELAQMSDEADVQHRSELEDAVQESQMKQMAYTELLNKVLAAMRYLRRVVDDKIPQDDIDSISEYPAIDSLED